METIARMPNQLGVALRRHRRKLGLTQQQLSDMTQLRQATISQLEAGEIDAQLDTILRVMAALELELVVRPRTTADNVKRLKGVKP